ncbi:MAG TPA: NAD(P)-binding domain-containing protein, partial [Gaiellaceae bacterium]|nr:NAD(P)-binding domain-containing protein [Gaiellaceae bacterium]
MRIAIVGGSGDFGRGLATRLRALGEDVVLGSRNPRGELVPNAVACQSADLAFLSVPPGAVEETVQGIRDRLAGKIIVSVAAPVVFRDGKPGAEPGSISLAEIAQRTAPASIVVAGFHTVSATLLARSEAPLDEDVLLAGDDVEAKAIVAGLADRLVEGRAVDAGRLEVARWLETLTAVL